MTLHRRGRVWNVAFRIAGRQVQLSTGATKRSEAQIRGAQLLLERASEQIAGPARSELSDQRRTDATIDEVLSLYAEWLESPPALYEPRKPRERTARVYANRLNQISTLTRSTRISQLRARSGLFTASQLGVTEANVVPLIRGAASIFSERALRFFASRGLEIENPFLGAIPPVIPAKRFRPPRREFLEKLMGDARSDLQRDRPVAYLLIYLALNAGLRQQEAAHLRECDLLDGDLQTALRVYTGTDYSNKTATFRDVPVSAEVIQELRRFCASSGHSESWLLQDLAEPYVKSKTAVPAQRACRAARHASRWLKLHGVPSRNPLHYLRKCFASYVAMKHGIYTASKWLGHSSVIQTEKVYAGVQDGLTPDAF